MRPSPARALRVIVADDSALVREAISHLFTLMPDVELVASCGDVKSLTAAVEAEPPDVIVVDVGLSRSESGGGDRIADRLLAAPEGLGLLEIGHDAEPGGSWHGHERHAYLDKGELLDRDRFTAVLHHVTRMSS